jgi:hypothetical protein
VDETHFDALARRLTSGAIDRRGLARGLAGVAFASGLALLGLDGGEARRERRSTANRRKQTNGGNDRKRDNFGKTTAQASRERKPGRTSRADTCAFTRCDGQCVNTKKNVNNCGGCGLRCPAGARCLGGTCALVFGRTGDGDGQLAAPHGLALAANGTILIADTNNQRIVRFAGGEFLGSFGDEGTNEGQFQSPAAVAVNRQGEDIFVVDSARHTIQRFDENGTFLLEFGGFGSGDGQFEVPLGIAVDRVGKQVLVADTGNTVSP